MSADYGTGHYKGYLHDSSQPGREPYIHVTQASSGSDYAVGDFTLTDIGELAEMAGQAWPGDGRVEVRYVIEVRGRYDGTGTNPHPWTQVWSALADDDFENGVPESYAAETLDGFRGEGTATDWRLVRRTTVTAVEVLQPEPAPVAAVRARLEADGAQARAGGLDWVLGRFAAPGSGHDSGHDDGLGQDQG